MERTVRRIAATLFCAAFLAAPAAAEAGRLMGADVMTAAVNLCDSDTHQLGVRATQGAGRPGERMFTRFSAEWLRPSTGRWEPLGLSESPWIDAGPGTWLYRTSGYTRMFAPAPPGETFTLRGVVEMEWRSDAGARKEIVVSDLCVLR